ncbi:MAG: DUF2071 domain-containing protein [Geodermatophilales bacterium]|nr:DUF2071 domain-containing protein [Geodermatophilales bacterium]
MHPEPVTAVPPRAARPALLRQDWRDVTLLHWPLDPAVAAPLLPPGTRPDELDGRTFAGLILLEMRNALPVGPPLPWLGTFAQANVRLYSVDREGRRGVVFLSLDAGRVLPALTARVAGLPYWPARVRVRRQGDCCGYRVDRRPGRAHASIDLRIGPRRDPGPLELFVAARWGLLHRIPGRTVYIALEHPPWELHDAELTTCDTDLLAAAGLPAVSGAPLSVLYSPGVDGIRLGPPG